MAQSAAAAQVATQVATSAPGSAVQVTLLLWSALWHSVTDWHPRHWQRLALQVKCAASWSGSPCTAQSTSVEQVGRHVFRGPFPLVVDGSPDEDLVSPFPQLAIAIVKNVTGTRASRAFIEASFG
jgi:hypothetical protein